MIFGIGIDIIEVSRLDKANIQKKVFTTNEIEYCEQKRFKAQYYAVRFAAKEAFLKALGTGLRDGIIWKDIEVVNDELGKPSIVLHQKAKELFEKLHISNIHVSLSHIKDLAIAVVILEN